MVHEMMDLSLGWMHGIIVGVKYVTTEVCGVRNKKRQERSWRWRNFHFTWFDDVVSLAYVGVLSA